MHPTGALIPTPAAAFVRIPRDTERTFLGVKRQRMDCERLAAKLGWTLVEVYEENDDSEYAGRPLRASGKCSYRSIPSAPTINADACQARVCPSSSEVQV